MYLSTRPPKRSTSSPSRRRLRSTRLLTDSGSMRSATAVYPDRSANTTVTWRRSSGSAVEIEGGGGAGARPGRRAPAPNPPPIEVPHSMQKRAPGGAGVPQLGQSRASAFPHDMQNSRGRVLRPAVGARLDAMHSRYGMPAAVHRAWQSRATPRAKRCATADRVAQLAHESGDRHGQQHRDEHHEPGGAGSRHRRSAVPAATRHRAGPDAPGCTGCRRRQRKPGSQASGRRMSWQARRIEVGRCATPRTDRRRGPRTRSAQPRHAALRGRGARRGGPGGWRRRAGRRPASARAARRPHRRHASTAPGDLWARSPTCTPRAARGPHAGCLPPAAESVGGRPPPPPPGPPNAPPPGATHRTAASRPGRAARTAAAVESRECLERGVRPAGRRAAAARPAATGNAPDGALHARDGVAGRTGGRTARGHAADRTADRACHV